MPLGLLFDGRLVGSPAAAERAEQLCEAAAAARGGGDGGGEGASGNARYVRNVVEAAVARQVNSSRSQAGPAFSGGGR